MATNQNSNGRADFKKLGVIWGPRTANSGKRFYSGVLNLKDIGFDKDVPIVIFENTNKRPDKKDPDLQIYLSTPQEGRSAPAAKPVAFGARLKSSPAPASSVEPEEEDGGVL